MSAMKSTLAFLFGATAGGAAALLLAPSRGEDARNKLRTRYQTGTERLEGTVHTVEDRAKGYTAVTREKLHDAGGHLRHHRDAVKEAFARGKVAYRKELERDQPDEASGPDGGTDSPDFV